MDRKFLEAGIIVNTHGVRGEVRIQPWADSPEFLAGVGRFFIDGTPVKVLSARVHKNFVIAFLEGVSDIDGAIKLKNKTVFIDRNDVHLGNGQFFIADLFGLRVIDAETGEGIGTLADVLCLPANNVYVIRGNSEILVPAVPDFIIETNIDEGFIRVRLIEGM